MIFSIKHLCLQRNETLKKFIFTLLANHPLLFKQTCPFSLMFRFVLVIAGCVLLSQNFAFTFVFESQEWGLEVCCLQISCFIVSLVFCISYWLNPEIEKNKRFVQSWLEGKLSLPQVWTAASISLLLRARSQAQLRRKEWEEWAVERHGSLRSLLPSRIIRATDGRTDQAAGLRLTRRPQGLTPRLRRRRMRSGASQAGGPFREAGEGRLS